MGVGVRRFACNDPPPSAGLSQIDSTRQEQGARAETHNVEHGNTFICAERPDEEEYWKIQQAAGLLIGKQLIHAG